MDAIDTTGQAGNAGFDNQQDQNQQLAEEFAGFFIESELIDIVLEDDDE